MYIHPDGSTSWYISADDYLKKAIPTVEAEWDESLYKKASSPLSHDYHPEMDTTPLLSDEDTLLYASYIGILQWAVELADKFPTRMDSSHRSPGYGNVSCPKGYET
jgi:hypothetical protein